MRIEKRFLWPSIKIIIDPRHTDENVLKSIGDAGKSIVDNFCKESIKFLSNNKIVKDEFVSISENDYEKFMDNIYEYSKVNNDGIVNDNKYIVCAIYKGQNDSLRMDMLIMPAKMIQFCEVVITFESKFVEIDIYTLKEKIFNFIKNFI